MIAAILICGAATFTSCTNEDNPVNPVDNLSEKIIGKWIVVDYNGQTLTTNEKTVYTFVSATKAYVSTAISTRPETGKHWYDKLESDVVINGNKITLTNHLDTQETMVEEYVVTAINGREFTANHKVTITKDGNVMYEEDMVIRLLKVTADYRETVLGLWECKGLTGGETFNDANARLEFLADGTYRYYRMDDNNDWQTVTTREFQDYFVDGTMLATRWKNQGEDELREWWEIESLSGNEMVWTALRQNADGSTFQQKMTWKRIDLNVAEKIIGKWMTTNKNRQPMLTNEKRVVTFVSATKAYMSASFTHIPVSTQWLDQIEADVVISDNKVTLTMHPEERVTVVDEYTVLAIDATGFTANLKVTTTLNGELSYEHESIIRLTKVISDYRSDVVGTWEGHCTSEGSEFDDGQEHRWQYKADGTYVYYVKDGDNWVPYEGNTLNEYFVDGNLLCTRWIDLGQENREWWEITINGNKMNWTALRENPDGTTFTATFEMKKVE